MESLFECNICFNIYNEARKPTMLPCGHAFCSTCVHSLVPEETFCPTCRQNIHVPFDQLPVVYSLLESAIAYGRKMVNSSNDRKKENNSDNHCNEHKDQITKWWCKISEVWLCDLCVEKHSHEESSYETNCVVGIEKALQILKAKIQKSHVQKLYEIQKIIEETEYISASAKDLTTKLCRFKDAQNILFENTEGLSEQSKELKKRSLRVQCSLTEFNLKLDEISTVKNLIEFEKELRKIEKVSEIQSDLLKLQKNKIEV